MNQTLKDVLEFHQTFQHPVGSNSNCVEDLKTRQLRIKLLFEELAELAEASDCQSTFSQLCYRVISKLECAIRPDGNNVNKLEELDALADIQYVLNGKIITAGLHRIFDREFAVVHQNNMTKAHSSEDEAQNTLHGKPDFYYRETTPGKFVVYNASGKVIKPYNHKKVQLSLDETTPVVLSKGGTNPQDY